MIYREGIASAQAGLALATEIGHAQWQAFGCMILGMLYSDLLAYAEARAYLQKRVG